MLKEKALVANVYADPKVLGSKVTGFVASSGVADAWKAWMDYTTK